MAVHAGLEYEVSGRDRGFPVVVHHGLIGAAKGSADAAALADEVGVRLITVARPGYGQSDPVDMESIAQWPGVLAPLLRALDVNRYAVWGVSAGAPYSYALAASDPDRVAAVVITSGLGHLTDAAVIDQYDDRSKQAFEFFRTGSLADVSEYWRTSFESSLAEHAGTDWEPLLRSALAHGAAGAGREAVLQQRPWGFGLDEVRCPVRLWHAPRDPMVPFGAAVDIARKIPQAVLHEQIEPDHVPSSATVTAALAYLASVS